MLDWQAIDTVFLDMDGTLLDLHFDNYFWTEHLPLRYSQIHDRDLDSVRDELLARIMSEHGSLNWYCLDFWSDQLKVDIPALKREISHLISIRPYVTDFLQWLEHSDRDVWLVTNAHQHSLDIKLEQTGLDQWLDHIIVSHDFGMPKESPDFWTELTKYQNFDPDRTLLIDDTSSVLASAAAYGIRHLLTLRQPDSKRAPREELLYPAIHHFDELLPEDALATADA